MTPQRIKEEAEKYIDQIHCHVGDMEYEAYIAGATAENDRAQGLVDALEEFISYHETGLLPARHVYEKCVAALAKWKGEVEQ